MNLTPRTSNRWCQVHYDRHPTAEKIRRDILRHDGTESDFVVLSAPRPTHDPTLFKVMGNETEILVGIAMVDSIPARSSPGGGELPDTVEVLLDPLDDQLGWVQHVFIPPPSAAQSQGQVLYESHLPYPEVHSSPCWGVRLLRHEWRSEDFSLRYGARRCRWLFAWFATEEVFRSAGHGRCGFNIDRQRDYLFEVGSWNFCAGTLVQDPTSFGHLYAAKDSRAPTTIELTGAKLDSRALAIEGRISGAGPVTFDLRDPKDQSLPLKIRRRGQTFTAQASARRLTPGRYRLYPGRRAGPVEPRFIAFDVPDSAPRRTARPFTLSVTYDPPMNLCCGHFTPQRLDREMALYAAMGLSRAYWIEYGDFPSFWNYPDALWRDHWPKTRRACRGDLFRAAASAAHANGMECLAILKTFDLAYNCFVVPPDGRSTVQELENKHIPVIPEIAAHQEWTMQSNPEWRAVGAGAPTRLRFWSRVPLRRVNPGQITVRVSTDNARWRSLPGKFKLRQGAAMRPHQRWTPAGNMPASGAERNWFIELDGLSLRDPFVAIEIAGTEVVLQHRGHMVAQAFDAGGQPMPFTIATAGSLDAGFRFWKDWPGWANSNEPTLITRRWRTAPTPAPGTGLALVFREMPNMPALLEPAYEGARRIWQDHIRGIIGAGGDGVDIRTLCHHNGAQAWLAYAFAAPVRQTFQELYGRPPRCEPEDYERVRRIRGECYTQFLREARVLLHRYGRKLSVQFECGMEVPPHLETRMAIHWEWERWLNEGIVDEMALKVITPESTFVHERLLPLARKKGIPVHLISRLLTFGFEPRSGETLPGIIRTAREAGFGGYSFYEARNIVEMNPEGVSEAKGPTAWAIGEAIKGLSDSQSRAL